MNIYVREIKRLISHNGTFNNHSIHLARPYVLKNLEHIKRTYNRKAVSRKLDVDLSTKSAMMGVIRKLVTFAGGKITTKGRKMKKGKYTYYYKILY